MVITQQKKPNAQLYVMTNTMRGLYWRKHITYALFTITSYTALTQNHELISVVQKIGSKYDTVHCLMFRMTLRIFEYVLIYKFMTFASVGFQLRKVLHLI